MSGQYICFIEKNNWPVLFLPVTINTVSFKNTPYGRKSAKIINKNQLIIFPVKRTNNITLLTTLFMNNILY